MQEFFDVAFHWFSYFLTGFVNGCGFFIYYLASSFPLFLVLVILSLLFFVISVLRRFL